MQAALDCLLQRGLSFGDLVLYVSDTGNKKGTGRYNGFFSAPVRVEEVLNFRASSRNSRTGRQAVHGWAVTRVKHYLNGEGNAATRAKFLQARTVEIDPSFVLDFSLDQIRSQLAELCPTALNIFHAFSTTARQQKEQSGLSEFRKTTVSVSRPVTQRISHLIAAPARHDASSHGPCRAKSKELVCTASAGTVRIRIWRPPPGTHRPLASLDNLQPSDVDRDHQVAERRGAPGGQRVGQGAQTEQ